MPYLARALAALRGCLCPALSTSTTGAIDTTTTATTTTTTSLRCQLRRPLPPLAARALAVVSVGPLFLQEGGPAFGDFVVPVASER